MDEPVVFVVDDNVAVLAALTRLLTANGLRVQAFASPVDFLATHDPAMHGCAVVDLAMPELDGLALQQALGERRPVRPVVFLTGRGDIPASVRAMKAGAVDFLTKPVDEEALLAAVTTALAKDTATRMRETHLDALQRRLATLTSREHQVFLRVVTGRLNKQIAADLGIAEKTIKVHRGHVMQKMGARSLADLVRISERLAADHGREPDALRSVL